MSGIETLLQSYLERVHPRWAREFGVLVREEEVRAALERLRRLGGDPSFALFVLTHYRWRRIKPLPAPREQNRLRRAIRLLLEGQGEWSDRVRALGGDAWKDAEAILRSALTSIESFHPVDESVFEARGTRHQSETSRALSDHASTCLLVLDWHLRRATEKRRTNRVLLGGLMDAVGLIKRSPGETSADPARWVEKRQERASKKDRHGHSQREFVEKFVVWPLTVLYHDVHESGGLGCGPACRSFERGFRAADQERLLYDAGQACATMRSGGRAEARRRFEQVLAEAERLLGPSHAGLVPILEGYAAALRAAGERAAAIVMAKRMAEILVNARRRRRDLVGFQPGAGPNGDLLPVWREDGRDGVSRTAIGG